MSECQKDHLEKLVLDHLGIHPKINDTQHLLQEHKLEDQAEALDSVLKSLVAIGYIVTTPIEKQGWGLSEEGKNYAELGTPEFRVYAAISTPCSRSDLEEKLGEGVVTIGWPQCIKQKWCAMSADKKSLERRMEVPADEIQQQLLAVSRGTAIDEKAIEALKKRKLALLTKTRSFEVTKGPNYATERKKLARDLSVEMLRNGSWATEEWKEYNFNAKAPVTHSGALHPLMKVRHEFRTILMDMGFEEMPTNRFVESSFWNFDALFQPQQHPSRESHDTFFLSDPATSHEFPPDYLERVKKVHEEGGYGSIGYRYKWAVEETEKNILRTHTTAISTRMLYLLAQQEKFEPKRYFSIDRVFRNETLDQTHLAEFHQVEGFVADYGLTLGDLIGVIQTFFKRIGIPNVRFKPAYNPYTEPSMEIFGYSAQLGRWIEVGNSGLFRPEMLRPMGFPEGVNVIAWGLSLERPTMIKYGIDNIRDLFGPKVKLDIIAKNAIARYES